MQSSQSSPAVGAASEGAAGSAPQDACVQERIEIEADGHRLTATLYRPASEPKGALQIHTGIGIKRQFYGRFASYLASHGYAVLTFDVRGMGESRFGELPGYQASLSDWGRKDMPAALDWLARRYPDVPKFIVAHSMGGYLTGLMPNHDLLSGLVLIFSPKSNVHVQSPMQLLQGLFFFGVFMPLTILVFGYAPVHVLMPATQDLPAGVAREWIRWSFDRNWMAGYFAARSEEIFHAKIKAPILAFALENDWLARVENCEALLHEYYTGAPTEFVTLRTGEAAPGLDHLRYFKREFADSHWSQVRAWLDRRVAQVRDGQGEPVPAQLTA
ncbi:MAG TPA: alpha/beta fold hydrolase [Polyangiaceae bacterium]|nr:alpha/beta fold hydrolase [Polyangiaceae bacterium]